MKFNLILADPPWYYRDRSANRGGAIRHYPVMRISEIIELSISKIAAKNCALFLWATYPNLPAAFQVMKAWDFQYKTVAFTWVKITKAAKLCIGMGHYTRANPELCLLGMRGKLPRQSKAVHNVVMAERGRHSQKPACIRDRIVQLFGDLPRIELFAREQVKGWQAWGNEVSSYTGNI